MKRRTLIRAIPAAGLAMHGLSATPATAKSGEATVELMNETAPQPIGPRGAEFLGSGWDQDGNFVFFTQVTGDNPRDRPVGTIQTWRVRQ